MKAGNVSNAAWHPHQIVTECENKDSVKHCTAIMALTGGSAGTSMDGVHVSMADSTNELIVSKQWSPLLGDMDAFALQAV